MSGICAEKALVQHLCERLHYSNTICVVIVNRTYLKIKSYRRKPVSSDFSVLNWQFVMLCFYIIKRQSHWIPGQARNDKRTQKTYFEIGSNYPNPPIKVVIASEAKQSHIFEKDCHAPFRCSQ